MRKSVGNALRDISKKFPELIKIELDSWKLESKEIKQVYYKEIQQELIEKLKEYEYYTSELFPDFEDYISYKTKEFSIVGESNKITPSPISRLRN